MKRLKRHRGITLVEVLISLILIGVIAAGFLTFFSGSFNNILRQRSQNAINFDIQESFEKQLAESKKHEGTGTDIETFTYQIGNGTKQSIDVKGTNLSYNDRIKKIHLFAANAIETPLGLPDLKVSIPTGKRYYYAGLGITTPGGKVDIPDSKKKSKTRIYTESGWFLSDRAIGQGVSGIVPVGTIGQKGDDTISQTLFPEMPTDFKQLSKLETGIHITDDMRGKYLTFAARAINSYGRVGNYQEADIDFHPGLNVFLGQNAQGKTNILEAIYFLALTRSHRTRSDKDLIHFTENDLLVSGILEKKTGKVPLDINLTPKGRITKVNHLKQSKLSDYIGTMNVVLFAPEDFEVIDDYKFANERE